MTILKTRADVDNITQLRRQKALLKSKIESEQTELKAMWQQLRTEYEPAQLATSVAQNLLGIDERPGNAGGLAGPLKLVADLFVRDPRYKLLFKFIAPMVVSSVPRLMKQAKDSIPERTRIYGALRRGVANLRGKLRRKKNNPGDLEADAES